MKLVFKVDVDLVVPKSWLNLWIKTRKNLESLGIKVDSININETERGSHAWIHFSFSKPTK